MSRLTELQEKYTETLLPLDPFPIKNNLGRYNNGNRSIFAPRPEYEQEWEVYYQRYGDENWGEQHICVSDSNRNRVLYQNGTEWPSYRTGNLYE